MLLNKTHAAADFVSYFDSIENTGESENKKNCNATVLYLKWAISISKAESSGPDELDLAATGVRLECAVLTERQFNKNENINAAKQLYTALSLLLLLYLLLKRQTIRQALLLFWCKWSKIILRF